MKSIFFVLAFCFTSTFSNASILAQKPSPGKAWSADQNTHVVVISKDLGFFLVGMEQVRTLAKNHPNDQFVVITTKPAATKMKHEHLQKLGFKILRDDDSTLSQKQFFGDLKNENISSKKIKSLTIIGHNGAHAGPWLQDGSNRLDYTAKELAQIKDRFTEDAYVSVMGCNSGWNVAPSMSKLLSLPVLSTFTSTGVYILTQENEYELFSDKTLANKKTKGCAGAECYNLRPESAPYHFHLHLNPKTAWLPMSKMVCDSTIKAERCQKAYANSLINTISSQNSGKGIIDLSEFENIFADQVCGAKATAKAQQSCRQEALTLLKSGQNFFPIDKGTPLNCLGLRACSIKEINNDLRLNNPDVPVDSITIIKDLYRHAMAGWKLLQL